MSLPTLAGNSRWSFEVGHLYGLTYRVFGQINQKLGLLNEQLPQEWQSLHEVSQTSRFCSG